jgi:membrane protein required for colicin V production
MNILDIAVLLVLGVFGYRGYQQGFTKMIINILTFFGGILLALKYFSAIQDKLAKVIHLSPIYLTVISFVLIWLAVWGAAWMLGQFLDNVMQIPLLRPIDRLAGATIGILKGALIIPVFLVPVLFLNPALLDSAKVIKPIAFVLQKITAKLIENHRVNLFKK